MTDPDQEHAHLREMHESAVLLREGGRAVALLPAFAFTAAGSKVTMDLLLVPFAHSGYTTRLFFERVIDCCARNWTEHRVVDQNWWAPSWNNVPESAPWPQMLRAHLRAVA